MRFLKTADADTRAFYKTLCAITVPIVIQNIVDAAVNAADVVMLGYVSQNALSATSLANQVQFVLSLVFFGIASGSSVLIAQYWGKGDKQTILRVIGIALKIALSVAFLFAVAAFSMPRALMRIFSPEEEIIEAGAQYLRIISLSYLCMGFNTIYINAMRSIERVRLCTVTHSLQLVMNILLNACFIFGLAGFPKLGIRGVALATLISRAMGLVVYLFDARFNRVLRLRVKSILQKSGDLIGDFIRYTLPALGNDIAWGLGFTMYSVILGHMGSDAVAANSIASMVRNVSTVVCFALSSTTGIILGKTMGENRLQAAELYAARFLRLTSALGILACVAIAAVSPFVVKAVLLSDVAKGYLRYMLIISAFNVIGQAVNTTLICGVFRSGGDTRFGFYMDVSVMWGYSVAIGSLFAFVLGAPVMVVYLILFLDEFVKMPFTIVRYYKKKWLKNITRDIR